MQSTLAIDPGRNCTGYALFFGSRLTACGLSVLPEGRWKLGDIASYHSDQIALAACDGQGTPLDSWVHVDAVYVEEMSLNKGRDGSLSKAIATGNDLLGLQAIGAFIAGRLGGELVYVSVPKHDKLVTRNRVLSTLTPNELDILDAAFGSAKWRTAKTGVWQNGTDAVLHGLRAVGRYG